ncbi:MAG: RNA methyltransferase, partial [Gemmataceae bacterium]|nr:RNA methyltransferase [Gemmataceae bacterium]
MSRSGRPVDDKPLPPLYAMTHGGVESVAADEITRDLGGEVKKTARGLVVFRVEQLADKVLSLRTTEDVFLMAWGSDSLTYKSDDMHGR